MTKVIATYERGLLRPEKPLPLREGETVEISFAPARREHPPSAISPAELQIRQAGSLQAWIEAANAAPDDPAYDILAALSRNRRPGERSLEYAEGEGETP